MNLREFYDKTLNGVHGEKLRYLIAGGFNTVAAYLLFALGLWLLTPLFGSLVQLVPDPDTPLHISAVWLIPDPNYPVHNWIAANSHLIIQWIMWFLSVPIGAATLKYFAFRAPGPYLPQAVRSYGIYLPMQIVASLLLAFFTLVMSMHPLLGQALTIFVTTIMSYFGHKYFTFGKSRKANG